MYVNTINDEYIIINLISPTPDEISNACKSIIYDSIHCTDYTDETIDNRKYTTDETIENVKTFLGIITYY